MLWSGLVTCLATAVLAVPLTIFGTQINAQAHIAVSGRESLEHEQKAPEIWPPPQQISIAGHDVHLKGHVTIVTGDMSDESTIQLIKDIVSSAGGKVKVSPKPLGHGTQIIVGSQEENAIAAQAASALAGKSAEDLEAEGYVLVTGKYKSQESIVLNGFDKRGTFYAAQTLRQLVRDSGHVPGVEIFDWPLMPVRGSVEGFYGIPWSHQARLDQFVLYGKHKLNTYIYTPKDDELLRRRWRDLYQGDELEKLKELVDTAIANYVDFTFALSPGNDLCYSSEDDFNATIAKFDQIRNLGVRRFYLALDDIPTDKFHCAADTAKWPHNDNDVWLADGQTYYLNRLQKEFIEANGLEDLETVPTHYAGSKPEPYKAKFGTVLNEKVRIHWTGEDVFSDYVTVESVIRAGETYVTENLFFWDNFPVNDGDFSRLFLNPLTERDPQLYEHLIGFTSNPMQQPYASMIALINYGDYTWNGPVYNATASLDEALRELAGSDSATHQALVAFVDLNQNWPYRKPEYFAPELNKDINSFWAARNASVGEHRKGGQALRKRLDLLSKLPDLLARMDMKGFPADVEPWSTAAMQWANALQDLLDMLDAIDSDNKVKAEEKFKSAQTWVEKTKEKTVKTLDREGNPDEYAPNIGDGAFQKFLADASAVFKGE